MKPLIFSTDPLHPRTMEALSEIGDLEIASSCDASTLIRESQGADFVIVRSKVPEEVAQHPNLKAFIRHGAGLDMIPVQAATENGVMVVNAPGENAITVAEHVIWSTLGLMRHLNAMQTTQRTEGWAQARTWSSSGRELSGKIMGIVGMGNLGRAVCSLASRGFGMPIRAVTSRPNELCDGAVSRTLHEAIAESDVVVLCCPLVPETVGLIGEEQLNLMKTDAILINVSRGPVVDTDALVACLQRDGIAGASLDVVSPQPLPQNHPLLKFRNVILTPHAAGISMDSLERIGKIVVSEVQQIMSGRLPENLCNHDVAQPDLSTGTVPLNQRSC